MQPIRFTPDVERVDPDEQRLTGEIVEQMNATCLLYTSDAADE